MKRVESLDYLRGLMALAVMVYHYTAWTVGGLESESVLGRLGIYAVSVFYILSGLSLAIVYHGRVTQFGDVRNFMIKRVFRIFPLFWIAVTMGLFLKFAQAYVSGSDFEFPIRTLILSYTLLFGFVDPTAYLTTGAWSIGNEMVFYTILPVVFLLSVRFAFFLPLAIFASVAVGVYFCFGLFVEGESLTEQWPTYINPFNQLFLFMGGVAVGVYGKKLVDVFSMNSKALWLVIVLSTLAFVLIPVNGDRIALVTGWNRLAFSFCCIIFVWALYILNPVFHSLPARMLGFFGEGCYSIYLLHPIVAMPIVFVAAKLGVAKAAAYLLAAFITLLVSWLTFKFVEKPMMNVGKKVVDGLR